MDSKIIPKLYMKLLPIQILLVIISGMNGIIDNVFASNFIGKDAMAVTGIFGPVTNFLNAINALFFGGAQVLCGKYLGRRMEERTKSIFTIDISVMIVVAILLTAVSEAVPSALASALGANDDLNAELASYIRGYAVGLPFFCLGTQFTAFLQLEHKEKLSYISIVSMFISNAFFNWLFIVAFDMGLLGLGLSTSIGNMLFFLIQAIHYLSGKSVLKFSLKHIVRSDLKDIVINGIPGASTQLCIFVRGIIIIHIIKHFIGYDGLAAYSAISSFGSVYWAVPAGVTSAVIVLGSVYVGDEDREGLKALMKTFFTRGLGIVIAVSAALSALCVPLTMMFFRDTSADVYRMTVLGFMLFPISTPVSAFTVGLNNYYHCQYHEKIVRIVSVIDGLIGVCLFSIILAPLFKMTGIWIAQIAGGLMSATALIIFATLYNHSLPYTLEKLMCFPEGFGVSEEDRIDISVNSMDQVINISEQVWGFCKEHNVDAKRTNCASLSVEELAGNIVRHGFRDGKKNSIDIRVSYVKGDIVISFKDDCIPFNPAQASQLFDSDDKTHNVGLRLASSIAGSMNYQNTFGLNILTIRI